MAMSVEARKAAKERMAAYWVKRRAEEAEAKAASSINDLPVVEHSKPIVEASVAVMEKPEEVIEAKTFLQTSKEMSEKMPTIPNIRTSSSEYRIIANSDGQMVCENGPCLCGVGKKEWHPICCK